MGQEEEVDHHLAEGEDLQEVLLVQELQLHLPEALIQHLKDSVLLPHTLLQQNSEEMDLAQLILDLDLQVPDMVLQLLEDMPGIPGEMPGVFLLIRSQNLNKKLKWSTWRVIMSTESFLSSLLYCLMLMM